MSTETLQTSASAWSGDCETAGDSYAERLGPLVGGESASCAGARAESADDESREEFDRLVAPSRPPALPIAGPVPSAVRAAKVRAPRKKRPTLSERFEECERRVAARKKLLDVRELKLAEKEKELAKRERELTASECPTNSNLVVDKASDEYAKMVGSPAPPEYQDADTPVKQEATPGIDRPFSDEEIASASYVPHAGELSLNPKPAGQTGVPVAAAFIAACTFVLVLLGFIGWATNPSGKVGEPIAAVPNGGGTHPTETSKSDPYPYGAQSKPAEPVHVSPQEDPRREATTPVQNGRTSGHHRRLRRHR